VTQHDFSDPEVLFKTCVAMKFVDDDDVDDDDDTTVQLVCWHLKFSAN